MRNERGAVQCVCGRTCMRRRRRSARFAAAQASLSCLYIRAWRDGVRLIGQTVVFVLLVWRSWRRIIYAPTYCVGTVDSVLLCAATCTCSAGYANTLTGQSSCGTTVAPCNECAQGTYCLGNAAQPAACVIGSVPAGSYCPAGTTTAAGTTCPAGSSCAGAAANAGILCTLVCGR